ncbi:SHOCT domain-containing protein [Candidatus Uhrbacteria bacterium]|nr:SHOCT domain-containing protein [Candidatus Uhrbacteria bacterium]
MLSPNYWEYGGWWIGIGMVLWWVLLVLVIVALVRWMVGDWDRRHRGKSARDILEERYVRGEISKAEFEEKRHDLGA